MSTNLLKHIEPTLVIYSLNIGGIHSRTLQHTIYGGHFIKYM